MIKKISYIFNRHQKIRMAILFVMIFFGSFVELLGVSAILPLVSVITNPDIINTDKKYNIIKNFFNNNSDSSSNVKFTAPGMSSGAPRVGAPSAPTSYVPTWTLLSPNSTLFLFHLTPTSFYQ